MLDKVKAAGKWLLIAIGALLAVVFGANALKQRSSRKVDSDDSAPAGKAPIVEAQAREVEIVNVAVDKLNTDVIPKKPTPAAGQNMEELVDEWKSL